MKKSLYNRLLILVVICVFSFVIKKKFLFHSSPKMGGDDGSLYLKTVQRFSSVPDTPLCLSCRTEALESIEVGEARLQKRLKTKATFIGCRAKQNVVFIKTHKTGGSTITNILNRYGDSKNLTFALPKLGEFRLNWPYRPRMNSFLPLHGKKPNILCNHARYDRSVLGQIMPTDTTYITILRNPADQFESAFRFFELQSILGIESDTPLDAFLDNPWMFLERILNRNITALDFQRVQLSRNGMLFDLGFDQEMADATASIESYIKKLDNEFSLVMLMEHFDESLILLKRLLCWSQEEIFYFPMNKRAVPDYKSVTRELSVKIKTWNQADSFLYDHFNKTFWRKVYEQGADFFEEVQLFRHKLRQIQTACLRNSRSPSSDTPVVTNQTLSFRVETYPLREEMKNEDMETFCYKMLMNEVDYVKYLQQRQLQDNKKSKLSFDD